MDDFKEFFVNGQLNKKAIILVIRGFTQPDRADKIKVLFNELSAFIKKQIDIWTDWSQKLSENPYNDEKYGFLKKAANPRETIANYQGSLKELALLQGKLTRPLAHAKKSIEERLLDLLELKDKGEEARKAGTGYGTYKIKINEKKKYTKIEAAEVLGFKSKRRVEQIVIALGIPYEKEKRGREKLLSGLNLKKIKKSRE